MVDLIQESRDFISHFLKVMTRDVEGPVGIIFDIAGIFLQKNFGDTGKFGDIGPEILPPPCTCILADEGENPKAPINLK